MTCRGWTGRSSGHRWPGVPRRPRWPRPSVPSAAWAAGGRLPRRGGAAGAGRAHPRADEPAVRGQPVRADGHDRGRRAAGRALRRAAAARGRAARAHAARAGLAGHRPLAGQAGPAAVRSRRGGVLPLRLPAASAGPAAPRRRHARARQRHQPDEAVAAQGVGADAVCLQAATAGGHRGTHTVAATPNDLDAPTLLAAVRRPSASRWWWPAGSPRASRSAPSSTPAQPPYRSARPCCAPPRPAPGRPTARRWSPASFRAPSSRARSPGAPRAGSCATGSSTASATCPRGVPGRRPAHRRAACPCGVRRRRPRHGAVCRHRAPRRPQRARRGGRPGPDAVTA